MFERITITLPIEQAKKIREYCDREDITLSALLRKNAIKFIEGVEND